MRAGVLIKTWDFLFAILILFPLLRGGIWLGRLGLFIELADMGAPTLIMSLITALVYRRCDLSQSFFFRFFSAIWKKWSYLLNIRPSATLWSVTLVVGLTWALASLRRHWALGSNSFDLGIFTNAIWNLTHGYGYVAAPKEGINLFSDHQSPVFWLLAPLFAVFPRPETLLLSQALGLATGGVAVFFIARQYLPEKNWVIAAVPLLYWNYLPIRNANAFDFHPEVFVLPLFLWGIAGIQSRGRWARALGAAALLVGLGAKETAGPIAMGMGLSWILGAGPSQVRAFTRRSGLALIVAGAAVFYLDVRIVPHWFSKEYAYNFLYAHFGPDLSSLLSAPILEPRLFWSHLFGPARLKYLFWTLAPLGFFPILAPRILLAALPGYLMLFLSAGDHRVNLIYHYAVEPAIGLLWALPAGICFASTLAGERKLQLWVLFFALATAGRSEVFRIRNFTPDPHQDWIVRKLVTCVDPQITLAAADAIVPHLSTRPWIHNLTQLKTASGSPVDCVITDPEVSNWPMGAQDLDEVGHELGPLGYQPVLSCKSLRVFQQPGTRCLSCDPGCN